MSKIEKIIVYIGLILVILFAIITFCGCVNGKAGVNDNPVSVATTMPVTLYTQADVDAAIKAALLSYEQKTLQAVNAGGNVNQVNFSLAGGGIVTAIIMAMFAVGKYKADKALKTCADVIEDRPLMKRLVNKKAIESGSEKYLHARVKKWYPNGSVDRQYQETTTSE